MKKIDFYGGLHGNFLELTVNLFIHQIDYDLSLSQFTDHGSCHIKETISSYDPITVAGHWSGKGSSFDDNDQVIQIVVTETDLLTAVTNSYNRAGDEQIDLDSIEKDTIKKLSKLSKTNTLLSTLTSEHGIRYDYPRSIFRNYFYSMFNDRENGLDKFNSFYKGNYDIYQFPFSCFFDISEFYYHLNGIAKFYQLNFYPTVELATLHSQFIEKNQGFHSQKKLFRAWQDIVSGRSENYYFNVAEEAWINWQISRIFRCYDHPELNQDIYPTNTRHISQIVFDWKSLDYPVMQQDSGPDQ